MAPLPISKASASSAPPPPPSSLAPVLAHSQALSLGSFSLLVAVGSPLETTHVTPSRLPPAPRPSLLPSALPHVVALHPGPPPSSLPLPILSPLHATAPPSSTASIEDVSSLLETSLDLADPGGGVSLFDDDGDVEEEEEEDWFYVVARLISVEGLQDLDPGKCMARLSLIWHGPGGPAAIGIRFMPPATFVCKFRDPADKRRVLN